MASLGDTSWNSTGSDELSFNKQSDHFNFAEVGEIKRAFSPVKGHDNSGGYEGMGRYGSPLADPYTALSKVEIKGNGSARIGDREEVRIKLIRITRQHPALTRYRSGVGS